MLNHVAGPKGQNPAHRQRMHVRCRRPAFPRLRRANLGTWSRLSPYHLTKLPSSPSIQANGGSPTASPAYLTSFPFPPPPVNQKLREGPPLVNMPTVSICHPDLPATQQIAPALRIVSSARPRRSRSPAHFSSATAQWNSASPVRRPASPRRACHSRRPMRPSARNGSLYRQHDDLSRLQRGLQSAGISKHDRACTFSGEAIRLGRLLLRIFSRRAGDHGAAGIDAAADLPGGKPASMARTTGSCFSKIRIVHPLEQESHQRGPCTARQGDPPSPAWSLSVSGGDRGFALARQAVAEVYRLGGDRLNSTARSSVSSRRR